jgi:hypothetical protein
MKYLKYLTVVALSLALFACSAKLPQADVDTATTAFSAAQAAQADKYAPESWKAASDANDTLQANLTAKEYGKTKKLAKALADAADKAKVDAATGLETMKTDAATVVTDINTLLPTVKEEVALAAKAGKKAKVDYKAYQTLLNGSTKVLADAQSAIDAGAVADAKAALDAFKTSLTDAQTALEGAGYKK